MNTNETKIMLEYVIHKMYSCKTVEECREVVLGAIEICEAHSIENLRKELGMP